MTDLPFELVGSPHTHGHDLVWGHGLTQSCELEDASPLIDWARVPARVLRYDARGHGEAPSSPDVSDYTWDALARDQLSLADSVGFGTYVSAGASMGCGTAIHAAVLAPERISALVLVIPPTAWETRAAQTTQWQAAAHIVESRGVDPLIANLAELPRPDPYVDDPDYLARRAAALRSWDQGRLAQVFRGAAGADLPPRDVVARLTIPCLILAWTGDPAHPESTARELAGLLVNSRLHLASAPSDLAGWTDLLAEFLSDLAPSERRT